MHSTLAQCRRAGAPATRRCSGASAAAWAPLAQRLRPRQGRPAVAARAWQQVVDQASGRPYYWNTATNETAWELPEAAAAAQQGQGQQQQEEQEQQQQAPARSFEELLEVLREAYAADGSGMAFWEAARACRADGVFDEPFMDFLSARQRDVGVGAEERDLCFKMQCRLSNPLLRQPAPFE